MATPYFCLEELEDTTSQFHVDKLKNMYNNQEFEKLKEKYYDVKLADLRSPEVEELRKCWNNRMNIYCYALLTILSQNHNGNKKGCFIENRDPTRTKQFSGELVNEAKHPTKKFVYQHEQESYHGHNIAALAVDENGSIISYSFNHVTVFKSTTEHAEERLVDKLFKNSFHYFGEHGAMKPKQMLEKITIFASLEPCHQCAGKLYFAGVKQVIYLQKDVDVGNIIRSIFQNGSLHSGFPLPIIASFYKFPYSSRLDQARELFVEQNLDLDSVPDFLCSDAAYDLFEEASQIFPNLLASEKKCSDWKPNVGSAAELTNGQVHAQAVQFCARVKVWGRGVEFK